MRLTPLDIKKQEFTRSFRGVDAQEVHDFLHELASQWDSLLDENRRLEQKVREYDSKLEHYRKIEEALQEALETARDNSHKTIENAQREAQIILKEARAASEEMRKKSSQDHKRLKHDISKISGRRDEIVARLRAFLMSEMELLARFEGQDPVGFVRLDHSDHHRQLSARRYHDEEREVPVNTPYGKSGIDAGGYADIPVDLPMDEEEVSYEEEDVKPASPERRQKPSAKENFDFSFLDESEEPAEEQPTSDGLSSDELEFIKSTVTSATRNVAEDDIFKPAEPEIDRNWNQQLKQQRPVNGQQRPSTPQPGPESASGAPRSNDAGGWIVRPAVKSNQEAKPPPPPSNRNFSSHLFGNDPEHDDLSATPEEIEKIRRILNDLD